MFEAFFLQKTFQVLHIFLNLKFPIREGVAALKTHFNLVLFPFKIWVSSTAPFQLT